MLQNKTILVVGGDLRQAQLARLLSDKNTVYTLGLEKAEDFTQSDALPAVLREQGIEPDYIIFPMPVSGDGETVNAPFSARRIRIDDVLSAAGSSTCVLGGKLGGSLTKKLNERKLDYIDYLEREELSVMNAIPTAEGAIQIAMEELPVTIYDLRVLVIGYGRIGKVLARLLQAMGARVTVSARKFADLAWIRANGYTAIHTEDLADTIPSSQLIINTVPAAILTEKLLSKVPKGCLVIDLSSKPGGIDFLTANKLGVKAIWALSLPGKVAPITAGNIIFDTIQNIESERSGGHVQN